MKVRVTPIQRPVNAIAIRGECIRLDAFLKLANAVESGGQAKNVIQGGRVKLGGEVCLLRGKKLRPGDEVRYAGQRYKVVPEDAA